MTTTTLKQAIPRERKPSRKLADVRPIEDVAKSERFAIANREWYPGLRAYYAERSTDQAEATLAVPDEVAIKKHPTAMNGA